MPVNKGRKPENGKLFVCRYVFDKDFRRTSGIKFKEICGENKAVIMTISKPTYHMHYILIDKNCFSCLYPYRIIKCPYFYYTIQYIDELQIFMPVHDLKARISGIGFIVDNIKNQIGKIRVDIQIDRIDEILFSISITASPLEI